MAFFFFCFFLLETILRGRKTSTLSVGMYLSIYVRFYLQSKVSMDRMRSSFELLFSANFNPSRRADYCVHSNTASCVLRHSKLKLVPQNYLLLQRAEKTSEVSFLCEFKMDIVIEQFANRMKKKKRRLQ